VQILFDKRQMTLSVRNGHTVQFGQRDGLDDGEAFGSTVREVTFGFVPVQPVKQFPFRIAQPNGVCGFN